VKALYISFLLLINTCCFAQANSMFISDSSKAAAKEKLEGYRQRVIAGESMSVLAALYTEDPGSVKTGGYYANIARGQFVPEFEKVAFALKPGEVSEIFETQFGFHFVQLIAHHDDLIDLRHILVKPK